MRVHPPPAIDSDRQVEEQRVWGVGAGIAELELRLWTADRLRNEQVRAIRLSRPGAAPYRLVRPEQARIPAAPGYGRPQDLHHARHALLHRGPEPAQSGACRVADDDRA